MMRVLLPDGTPATLRVLRWEADVSRTNLPEPASFSTAQEARAWSVYCMPDRVRIDAVKVEDGP